MFRRGWHIVARWWFASTVRPLQLRRAIHQREQCTLDQWLKQRDPRSGIRDFADLNRLAEQAGMQFQHDYTMPVNNRTLVWLRG
nr:DUF938 domain-containing protein [Candidatus Thiothrix anitrata]